MRKVEMRRHLVPRHASEVPMFVQEAGEHEGTWEESELSQSIHRKISTASEMTTIPTTLQAL